MIDYLEETYARSQRPDPLPKLVILTLAMGIGTGLMIAAVMMILRMAAYFAPTSLGFLAGGW